MKRKLLIIISFILLLSVIGCTAEFSTEKTSEAAKTATIAVSTTAATAQKEEEKTTVSQKATTAAETTSKTSVSTTAKSDKKKKPKKNADVSTTKKETTSKHKTAAKKKTRTQIENYCYITIECKAIIENIDKLKEGHESFVPENGIIVSKTKCTFEDGATAYDILEKVCKDKGIRLTSRDTVYGIYVSGINNLDEFDCGSASGWVYTVNSHSPPKSCGKYVVSAGDEIVFKYVC